MDPSGFRRRRSSRSAPSRRVSETGALCGTPERDPSAVAALRERVPGQVLFERATCWTDPPRVTPDVSGLLGQRVVPPWAGQMRRLEDGTVGSG